ncbi:MAG TPA: N-acetylmuramoyl-L-alanine amidase [Terriglobales bacterium]|nr:N-acetylmuramoyl-L-alanine amidase [Terriglobales bacterium]
MSAVPQGQTQSKAATAAPQAGQLSPNQPSSSQAAPPAQPAATPPKPLVMIDPAHGGTESGAVMNPTLLEKDVTLALARRLRIDLGTRGFVAELIRDSDVNLSTDDRAAMANAAHPALYVCLHATSEPDGIGIYTAMLAENGATNGPFIDWNTAQFSFLPQSRTAQQEIAAAMQKSGMPVRSLTAPLRPLSNVTSPAIAVELAPAKADVSQVSAGDFQQNVSTALANGIAQFLSNSGAMR